LVLGVEGFVLSLSGSIAAILMDLGPDWYPVALVSALQGGRTMSNP